MPPSMQGAQRALIVHAHPEGHSFSAAQMREAACALGRSGYSVDVLDLYATHWEPVLDRNEFRDAEGPFKPQAAQMRAARAGELAPDVSGHLEAVLSADLLVLSFPMWWFSVPAILKGWIDRVFVMGAVFGGELGLFGEARLQGRRAMVLATTGGPATSFDPGGQFGDINTFLFHIHRGMLEFVGYDVLAPVVTYGPARMDDEQRVHALSAVREAFNGIERRARADAA